MYTKNKHIIVLFCYNNIDHIIKCYNSLKNNNIDFFIVENYSKNSNLICNFFKGEKIIGHILFEENIVNKAIEIFINDYFEFLSKYSLVTITDCDLYSENSSLLVQEIYSIIENKNIGVCCAKLSLKNLPNVPGANSWLPKEIETTNDYIETNSGIHMMTLNQRNLNLIKNVRFLDSNLIRIFKENDLKWVTTKENDVLHLTWDLYYPSNEYYNFKLNKNNKLWNSNKTCKYSILK